MKRNYKARFGYPINDEDAKIIGSFIDENFPDGKVDAEDLVDLSKDPKAITHRYFDWDNKSAAHRWRIHQAQRYIKAIVVSVEGEDTPAFHHVYLKDEDKTSYVRVDECLKNDDLWQQVIQEALRQAESWSARYQRYEELSDIVVAIQKTKEKVTHANNHRDR